MPAEDTARYAIYFAPPEESPLDAFARTWLGRDAATGDTVAQPSQAYISPKRLREITASPRHYGFHATLKPPFRLADGATADDLRRAAAAFAAARSPFDAQPLALRSLDGFVALMLSNASPEMEAFAADCVEHFDPFRRPADAAELAMRRAKGLTARQDEMLRRWGYPYVFDEFRFHMTLTERLGDAERETVMAALAPLVAPFCRAPLRIAEICLYRQPDRESPFMLTDRFPFGG